MVSTILYYLFNIAFLFFTIYKGFFVGKNKKIKIFQTLLILFLGFPIIFVRMIFFVIDKFEDWYYACRNNKRN